MVKVQTCGFATIFHEIFFGSSKKNKSSKPGGDFFASSPHQGLLDVKNWKYWLLENAKHALLNHGHIWDFWHLLDAANIDLIRCLIRCLIRVIRSF